MEQQNRKARKNKIKKLEMEYTDEKMTTDLANEKARTKQRKITKEYMGRGANGTNNKEMRGEIGKTDTWNVRGISGKEEELIESLNNTEYIMVAKKHKNINKRNEIRISTWNVRTMLVPGKINEVAIELDRYKIDIAAIQETRWKGQGTIDKSNYTFRYSGNEKQGQYGVAFMIMGKLRDKVKEFKPINERMAYMRIEAKPFNLSILNVYSPTEKADEDEKEKFYGKIEDEIEKIPKEDTVIILGDFNAQIGKEEYIKQVAGKYTTHEKTNDNGQRLCNLAVRTNMVISSTKYKHTKWHKVTWRSPDQKTYTQIDHVLITRRKQSSIRDVRTFRGACADSDHFMVTTTLRQKVKRSTKTKKNMRCKWDVKKLNNTEVREKYAANVEKQLKEQITGTDDVQMEWNNIKECINKAAEEEIGIEKRKTKKEWYDEKCQTILKQKIEARIKWIRTNKKEDREEYEKIRKDANKIIRRTKREWIDDKIKDIEKESTNRNTKAFYKKISEQNKIYKGKTRGIKDKEGRVTENEKQYKEVWVKYYKELLTETETRKNEKEEEEEEGNEIEAEQIATEPTREEVKESISKSRNGKTPGNDGINMELIKYGGEELQERLYALIKRIWKEERMPKEWETGQIITIHKKGDQQMCKNYRGLTLLNTAYKVMSIIIQQRLSSATRNTVGQYQCGFTRGRSTIDAIHTLKQIMEKAHEYHKEIELLFVDYQQAFDSINRQKLMEALRELGVDAKLRRLIQMTMRRTTVSIKTQSGDTEEFEVNKGIRQGDSLSATLFNLALEYVTKKIDKGTLRTRGGQIIAYADDIVIISKNRKIMEKMLEEMLIEGEKMGLKINEGKTKIMRFDRQLDNKNKKIKIGKNKFEEVNKFKYLGVTISNDGDRETEIKEKIISVNKVYHANRTLLKNNILGKKVKMRIYRTIIRPTILYGAETMTMTKKQEEDLRIVERKILRTILGPIKTADNEYRRRTNYELLQEINEDVVKKIKEQRIKWLGHIWRAGPGATMYTILDWKPGSKRRRGRPRSTWLQEVKEDLKRIGVHNWQEKARDRKLWREISKKVKS